VVLRSHVFECLTFLGYYIVPTGKQLQKPNQSKTRNFHGILLTCLIHGAESFLRRQNWFADCQEILRISRNPKVHYRTHMRPPPVSILGQPNPVYIPTSHFLESHPNIIHPSTPRSPQLSPSLRFPQQDPIHPPWYINLPKSYYSETDIMFLLRHLRSHYYCLVLIPV